VIDAGDDFDPDAQPSNPPQAVGKGPHGGPVPAGKGKGKGNIGPFGPTRLVDQPLPRE
jgi:hypothetical protein